MQVNEVVVNGVTELSLVNDTVSPEALAEGATAHDASGQAIEGIGIKAKILKNYYNSRPTSANIPATGDGGAVKFLCTSSMTEGAPPMESHIIHMNWDSTSGWDAQLAVGCGQNKVYARNKKSGTWQDWFNVADGGAAATAKNQSSVAGTSPNASYLRQIASGTAAATTSNCPSGALYGQYS